MKKQKKQQGQAMVETAIMLPLLVMLLIGVGYFGSIITLQHNLSVAARYAARAVAIESSKDPMDRDNGTYLLKVGAKSFRDEALKALPGFDVSRLLAHPIHVDQIAYLADSVNKGRFEPIPQSGGFAFVYKLTGKVDGVSSTLSGRPVGDLRGLSVGVGAIFYGVRLTYRLKELDWMAGFLFRKREGITIEGISMMPAELPLRSTGGDYGLMDLNNGLFKIMTYNVRTKSPAHDYEDLIPE